MSITSRDLAGEGVNRNPIFGEREIKGSARIQNNRTLMLASVAQSREKRGKEGLPLLGLIPIIGRLFATPTKDDSQVDIVIAVTPRVLRAPVILPEDEVERPTGSIATPTNSSLEAMIIQEEREEQLANARRQGNTANVQLPDQKVVEVPQYVKSSTTPTTTKETTQPQNSATTDAKVTAENKTENPIVETRGVPSILKPIDTSVKTLQINTTSDTPENKTQTSAPKTENNPETIAPKAELKLLSGLPEMKAGEKTKIAVQIRTASSFRSAVLGLKFDAAKVAVRSVQFGDVFGAGTAQTAVTPFVNMGGMMRVSLSSERDTNASSSGILAYVEIEALTPGVPQIALDTEILNVLTVDGKNFELKY
jgi:hypothetical protein